MLHPGANQRQFSTKMFAYYKPFAAARRLPLDC